MATEGDPTARYTELMDQWTRARVEYMHNLIPDEHPAVGERLLQLRDAIVSLLDSPANLRIIAEELDRPEDTFVTARDTVRDQGLEDWEK